MIVELFGERITYEVLATNPFNADRKRMSVLIRDPNTQKYYVMCKGADNIMLPLCSIKDENERTQVINCLDELAKHGLRTLIIAMKVIDESIALKWLTASKHASISTSNRDDKIAAIGAELETDMQLIGVTAIEDRLQDEVPEVIADLAKAGIILWMLTGDKLETAINIGRSCNLILSDTNLVEITKINSFEEFGERLTTACNEMNISFVEDSEKRNYSASSSSSSSSSANPSGVSVTSDSRPSLTRRASLLLNPPTTTESKFALVIDGPSFTVFNDKDKEQRKKLLKIGQSCRSVIACRLTPTQKKELVKLVKIDSIPKATTLAIGDGANDVAMIMEGDVGVGIYGKEGRQAANNADFAIGEFKFLRRLLLVHGRWNYIRQSKTFLYSMHKNMVITLTLFWYR
jgi:phospholipid-translocating ATPase